MGTDAPNWAEKELWARRQEGASGEIIIVGGQLELRVYLQDGLLAWATSNRTRHAFSRYLVEHNFVANAVIIQAVADCRREVRPLGEWLVEKVGVPSAAVSAALRYQIGETLRDLRELPPNGQTVFIARSKMAVSYKDTLFDLKTFLAALPDQVHSAVARTQYHSSSAEPKPQRPDAPLRFDLSRLDEVEGYIGMAMVDGNDGTVLGKHGNCPFPLEVAAVGDAEVIRAERKVMQKLGITDKIEDILVSLHGQYHIIRSFGGNDSIFLYMVLDRSKANLAMARHVMRSLEQTTKV